MTHEMGIKGGEPHVEHDHKQAIGNKMKSFFLVIAIFSCFVSARYGEIWRDSEYYEWAAKDYFEVDLADVTDSQQPMTTPSTLANDRTVTNEASRNVGLKSAPSVLASLRKARRTIVPISGRFDGQRYQSPYQRRIRLKSAHSSASTTVKINPFTCSFFFFGVLRRLLC